MFKNLPKFTKPKSIKTPSNTSFKFILYYSEPPKSFYAKESANKKADDEEDAGELSESEEKEEVEDVGIYDKEDEKNDKGSKKKGKSQEEMISENRRKISIEELDKIRRRSVNKVIFKLIYRVLNWISL